MITALLPLAASAVQTLTGPGSPLASPLASPVASASAGPSFGEVMAQTSGAALKTLKSAESVSMAGLQGKASVQQVTDSVMSAERTLQTGIAIRDKAVGAWQNIAQMQI